MASSASRRCLIHIRNNRRFIAVIVPTILLTYLIRIANDTLASSAARAVPHDLRIDGSPSKMYFIVTASIQTNEGTRDQSVRQQQYTRAIRRLIQETQRVTLPLPFEIIIVENNGQRKTFLDDFGVTVVYTDSNKSTEEKGIKELNDVLAVVNRFNMSDADLIVKMTGRYYLTENSQFINLIHDLALTTRALVKFGSYSRPREYPVLDCVTGLIMVPVAVIRTVRDTVVIPIEHAWARAALSLPENEVQAVRGKMGIYIAPAGKRYRLI